ncbi:MAG: polysaccharide deacetylase family protein [Rhodospirillales bacterium]|nr:polysaccharide deacetylase family protein [Rhodospirillales bacterium]
MRIFFREFQRVISTLALFLVLASAPAWVPAWAPAWAESSAVIFMYHRFGEDTVPSTNTPLAQFEAHLAELKSGPYTVLPVPDIISAIREGRELPDRTVGITIDDAYLSVYTEAWPRLRSAGFPATLFVATELVDRHSKGYLNWDQIRELAAGGFTIGGHTVSHPHMAGANRALNRAELENSNARFREMLGRIPDLFAYPYGEASAEVAELVKASGYRAAFGQHSGVINPSDDFFYLPRFALNEIYGSIERFRLAANALPIPVTDMTPADPLIGTNNPPSVGFTVSPSVKKLERLTCFSSHSGAANTELLGQGRVEVRVAAPFPKGRTRINCTLPAEDGRWRWLGRQFYFPG